MNLVGGITLIAGKKISKNAVEQAMNHGVDKTNAVIELEKDYKSSL